MKWNRRTDTALRLLAKLAEHRKVTPSAVLAQDLGISQQATIQLASLLQPAGLVEVVPGSYGGYFLAKDPDKLSLYEVIVSMESPDIFFRSAEQSPQETGIVDDVFCVLQEMIDSIFKSITISDIAKADTDIITKAKKKSLNEMILLLAHLQANHTGDPNRKGA